MCSILIANLKKKCPIFRASFQCRQTPTSEWLTQEFFTSQPCWLGSSSPSCSCAISALYPLRSLQQRRPGKGSLALYYLASTSLFFCQEKCLGLWSVKEYLDVWGASVVSATVPTVNSCIKLQKEWGIIAQQFTWEINCMCQPCALS